MINKISILLLAMIFQSVQPKFWRIVTFEAPITKQFSAKFKVFGVYGCLVHCSTYYSSQMVSVQDDFCYCLKSDPLVNSTESVNLDSMMTKLADQSDCTSKGYNIYPELGVCIKFVSIPKKWLDAVQYCNQDGGYLLNVNSEAKLNASIDIVRPTGRSQILVGASAAFWNGSNTKYHWTRGGLVDRFWLSNQPSFQSEREPCVTIMSSEGLNNHVCYRPRCYWKAENYLSKCIDKCQKK